MSINFTYKIVRVDEENRCMDIVYEADGYPTQYIGARLPYEDEEIETVIRMYAPVPYWLETQRVFSVPEVGISGIIKGAEEAAAAAALQSLQASTELAVATVSGAQEL